MQKIFLLIFILVAFNSRAQSYNLEFKTDSLQSNFDVIYKYSILKQGKSIYQKEGEATEAEIIKYHSKSLNYEGYLFYDLPVGVQKVVLYNFYNGKIYESEWYDFSADGDKMKKQKVDFKNLTITIQKADLTKKLYKVKLMILIQPSKIF